MAEFKAAVSGETEAQFRQFLSYLFKQASTAIAAKGVMDAVGDTLPLKVQQTATASANVEVLGGCAVVQDTVLNGVSPLLNNTTKTLDILGANPMGATPRNDIVVFDAATSSIRNLVGTPNASPVDPTVPATAVPLARLRHAASATTVPTAKIDDLRVFTSLAPTAAPAPAVTAPSGLTNFTQVVGVLHKTDLASGNIEVSINAELRRTTSSLALSTSTYTNLGIFMPAGYRLTPGRYFVGMATLSAAAVPLACYIDPDGSLRVKAISATTLAVNDTIHLATTLVGTAV